MRNNVSLLLSPPFSLPEGVQAVRQRVKQEICWTNNLRSSTTSSTQSLIQLASCVWCPETTYSTGIWQSITINKHCSDPLFHWKIKSCFSKESHWYCGSSVNGASQDAKAFINCLLWLGLMLVCVWTPNTDVVLRCWHSLYYLCGFIIVDISASDSANSHSVELQHQVYI